jgi:hypothetical protein
LLALLHQRLFNPGLQRLCEHAFGRGFDAPVKTGLKFALRNKPAIAKLEPGEAVLE